MRRLSRLFIAAVSTTALTQVASAADLPVKAPPAPIAQPYRWTGWYVGANAGALWGHSDVTTSAPCTAAGLPPAYFCELSGFGLANAVAVSAAGSGSLSDTGFIGGIQGGYNWQNGNVVYGLEADFNAFHFRGSRSVSALYPTIGPFVSPTNTFTVGISAETDWLFTARGRIGWTVTPTVLAYATGGLAVTELKVANSFTDDRAPVGTTIGGGSNSKTKLGWTIGAGVEWAFDRNWSAKIEYLYVDFGSVSVDSLITHPGVGGGAAYSQLISTSADLTAHIARAGVNYKF